MSAVERLERGESVHARFTYALDATRTAQKSVKGAPAYSRYVNRRLGRVLAAAAYVIGLSPNQVTVLSGLCSLGSLSLVYVFAPTPLVAILVGAGLILGYALDSADGQLSRLQRRGSLAGEWLDHMVDATKVVVLHGAVLTSYYRFGPGHDSRWLVVPLVFGGISSVYFFGTILTDKLRRENDGARRAPGAEPAPAWRSLAALPTDYGVLAGSFFLLGAPAGFRWAYLFLMALTAAYLSLVLVKWFRELDALARPTAA